MTTINLMRKTDAPRDGVPHVERVKARASTLEEMSDAMWRVYYDVTYGRRARRASLKPAIKPTRKL